MLQRLRHQHWYRRPILWACAVLLVVTALPPGAVSAFEEGDGMMVYGVNTVASSPYKQYTASPNTWTSPSDLSTDTFSVRFTKTVSSPTEGEMIQMHSNSNGQYRVHNWDGSAWSLAWTDTGGGSTTSAYTPRFDMAYDQSGNAIVVYSANTTGTTEISYRTYANATDTWSAEQSLNAQRTSGAIRYIRVEQRPGTDEFAIAWQDAAADLSATYYDLSANTFYGEPGAAFTTNLAAHSSQTEPGTRIFDLAFETNSGQLLLTWGENAVTDLRYATRTAGTGGSWSAAATYTTAAYEGDDIELSADPDPTSDKIAYVNADDAAHTEGAIWSGSAWDDYNAIDPAGDTLEISSTNVSVEWLRAGGNSIAVFTFDDINDHGIDWATFDANTVTWTTQTDHTATLPTTININDKFHRSVRNPLDSTEMNLIIVDGNNDLIVKRLSYNGSTFTWSSMDDSGSSHNVNQNNHGGWTAAFAYYTFAVIPTLSVDIVDSGDSSVASPSVTMGAVTSGNTCQTPTGTLGTSSQKIRLTNTTTNPAWSLTVAATGGATANWSATTYTYDYNDSTSSGCGDGGDADSLAGQLTIDASGGTRTPQSGCNTTGISLGSSSAFAEGTTNSITLLSASGSASTGCYWDLTGVTLSQKIPSYQEPGSYALQLTLTVTAN